MTKEETILLDELLRALTKIAALPETRFDESPWIACEALDLAKDMGRWPIPFPFEAIKATPGEFEVDRANCGSAREQVQDVKADHCPLPKPRPPVIYDETGEV